MLGFLMLNDWESLAGVALREGTGTTQRQRFTRVSWSLRVPHQDVHFEPSGTVHVHTSWGGFHERKRDEFNGLDTGSVTGVLRTCDFDICSTCQGELREAAWLMCWSERVPGFAGG